MENQFESLVEKSIELGALEAKLVDTDQIYFDPRSFLKCRFGCNRWGKYWTCPPNMDISPERFMEAYQKYLEAVKNYWIIRAEMQRSLGGRLPAHV